MSELEFVYRDHFSYDDFLKQMAPLVEECIIDTYMSDIAEVRTVAIDKTITELPEIDVMFREMGLDKFDGMTDISVHAEFTSIDASVVIKYGRITKYGKITMYVDGSVSIKKENQLNTLNQINNA